MDINEDSRADKIKDNIDEINNTIQNLEIVMQGLRVVKDKANRLDEKMDIKKLIDKTEREIDFLNDIKESDENTLLKL